MRDVGTGVLDGPFHQRPVLCTVILSDRRESKDPLPPEKTDSSPPLWGAQNDMREYAPSFLMSS